MSEYKIPVVNEYDKVDYATLILSGSDVDLQLLFNDGVADRYFGRVTSSGTVVWSADQPEDEVWNEVERFIKAINP